SIIQPIDSVFNSYPKVKLNEAQTRMYSNGVKLKSELIRGIDFNFNSDYRVYGSDDKFIGIGKVNDDNLLCVRKNF
ncbi:MAG: tRNA pseudouridine(55) synthase TruB, partial [Ruminococcus sp.]|nr:tRNA pseudouridine(55) synthase TruB [Ruminococcus sp.]